MAIPGTTIIVDVLFCSLLFVFVRADQAWLASRLQGREKANRRRVRALPFVVLGALLGLLVLPIYWCASRGRHRDPWPCLAVALLLTAGASLYLAWLAS